MSVLPKQCCATGSLHTGTPTGRIDKIHGRECYVAEPPTGSPKGIVVLIPDIFGWTLPNSRILADEYAKKGSFLVYLPDFMNGYVIPGTLLKSLHALEAKGFSATIMKFYYFVQLLYWYLPFAWRNRQPIVREQIISFFKALRANEGADLPIGAAGFCWGGKWTIELCADEIKTNDGKRLVDCGYTAHPSMITVPDDIEKVVLPLSVAAASYDSQLPKPKADQTRDILKAKSAKSKDQGIEHEFVWYEGAHHGFAVRASEDDKEEAERGKKAEAQAIAWFSRWFQTAR